MNNGYVKEDLLVKGLFKNKEKFSNLENAIEKTLLKKSIVLDKDNLNIIPVISQDNKKDNHTWDCIIKYNNESVGISIKSNYTKATKHPQHKSLIKHVFSDGDKLNQWMDEFVNIEKEVKKFLLKENPEAKFLKDVRKDVNNKTIKRIDVELSKIYQNFFYRMFNSGLSDTELKSFLIFSFSSKPYLKITWNNKDTFILEDFMNLDRLVNLKLDKVEMNGLMNNVDLFFENGLVLSLRFKISFYKKHLTGSSVKGEINIKSLPKFISKEVIK
jgi:hypothetical protein